MMPLYPTDKALSDVVREKLVVVIEVGNDFCNVCPAINYKLAAQLSHYEQIALYYISLNAHPAVAAALQIFSAPAVLVYIEGQLTIKEAGYFSVEEILARIDRYLKMLE